MKTSGQFEKGAGKGTPKESRTLLCELCGAECEIDPESGESHCPVCESPEP